eukprot:scaffold22568_cov125-Cylindrotheca_fusiformis.AAC.6
MSQETYETSPTDERRLIPVVFIRRFEATGNPGPTSLGCETPSLETFHRTNKSTSRCHRLGGGKTPKEPLARPS